MSAVQVRRAVSGALTTWGVVFLIVGVVQLVTAVLSFRGSLAGW